MADKDEIAEKFWQKITGGKLGTLKDNHGSKAGEDHHAISRAAFDAGVRLGFSIIQRAAAKKCRTYSYESLAVEIEKMEISRKT